MYINIKIDSKLTFYLVKKKLMRKLVLYFQTVVIKL